MSSTVFAQQHPSPASTRRPPVSNEDNGYSPQRTSNRRSLSGRLRNLFRKDSSSPSRTTSNDRRTPTSSIRQTSSSPRSNTAASETPHLRTPTVDWSFGKKKPKLAATASVPKTSKTKIKSSRKTKQYTVPPLEISSPIYEREDQNFNRRSPEISYGSPGRLQSPSYEVTPAKGYRDYVVIDQTQQVNVPDIDVFPPPIYTSDHSRSPSMNRQYLPSTNIEYNYPHDSSALPLSIPLTDIEVISTPQRKRKVGDTSLLTKSQILAEKPPKSPQSSYHPSSTIQPFSVTANPTQWTSASSSSINHPGRHSTKSSTTDVDVPKLHAPLIPFGSASSKKKAKRSKSQSRTDYMTNSTSTISNLVRQNPLTYRSLPDAEIIHGSSLTSLKPTKSNINRYPGLSAIVQHHYRPAPVYYNERPTRSITKTPPGARRFDTSTTTLNEYEDNQPWPYPTNNGSAPSTSSIHRHDGFIRPITPQKQSVQPDLSVIRVSLEDLRARSPSPPPRPSRYDSPESPAIYRSSTTVYARDKHHFVNGGEIRTWSSRDNGVTYDHNDSYKTPHTHIHVECGYEREKDYYDHQVVPPTIQDNYDEYRYSREQVPCGKPPRVIIDNEQENQRDEEERYEVSYELANQRQYSYEPQKHFDEVHSTNRYSNEINGDQSLAYSNHSSTVRSSIMNERDQIYDHSSRSYTNNGRIQEPLAPVRIPRTYRLRRSNSYDGLGITIVADSQTRSSHFIREVEPGSPGDQAGLRKNDRIVGINGINVENFDFNNILILMKQGLDDDNLQLTVIHELDHI